MLLFPRAAGAEDLKIDDLHAPLSPAFVLLGVEPTSVERPETPKAVMASLFSALQNGDTIPRNYALSVAPYWLYSHPKLTFDEYYRPDFLQGIAQSFSVSMATSKSDAPSGSSMSMPTMTPPPALAVGVRTLLVSGNASEQVEALVTAVKAGATEMAGLALDIDQETDADKKAALQKKYAEKASQVKKDALALQAEDKNRVGFSLELAGGAALSFPGDRFENGELSRAGAWLTAAYRCQSRVAVLLVSRYQRDEQQKDNLIDVGGRVLWTTERLDVSAESVARFAAGSAPPGSETVRVSGLVEYLVRESSYITLSFGRNFSSPVSGNDLIAILGLSVGFGSSPAVKLQ